MIADSLDDLFGPETVKALIREVDAVRLARDLQIPIGPAPENTVSTLRIAAITAMMDLLADDTLDDWLRQSDRFFEKRLRASKVFSWWAGYIDALNNAQAELEIDDVLYFATSGLLAERPNEVRDTLRRQTLRSFVDSVLTNIRTLPWLDRVRANISLSLLLLIRQEQHSDVYTAGSVLRDLANLQREIEPAWLESRTHQQRDAFKLLGFYHLAEAILRTSEFLLAGSVVANGKIVHDFSAELRRQLVRSEELLRLSSDQETALWLTAIGITLVSLRESSIWVQARGISERIDNLIDELTSSAREQPILSLLPSQQEALRQALLDRSRMAVVLQMPTSSGKTLLAEFSIVQTFDAYRDRSRVVYLVPTRALATQVRRTLAEDLRPLGIEVSAAGSAFEEDPYEINLLQDADGVVVSTPEKLDLLLRAHPDWFANLRLVVVDEAHLLRDAERGVRLELLLANLRRELPASRLLLLTPFMNNAQEIASWLSRERGLAISVHWRPSRIILGMAKVAGRGKDRQLVINWQEPTADSAPKPLVTPATVQARDLVTTTDKIIYLTEIFEHLGTILAIFSASPAGAEEAATKLAHKKIPLAPSDLTPQLRLAIALAKQEYGSNSRLAYCLERGISFHHSSLSPILRYLVEDQIRAKKISFVAATSTLAQGMNFPVATVLVHSIHKPNGGGKFSSSEFWNIAGRAGRVGMTDEGLVIFTNPQHQLQLDIYARQLTESLRSALLDILENISPSTPLKQLYREFPALRPFIQYLAHAAANSSPGQALANLEELLQQSLANQQIRTSAEALKLRTIARSYLRALTSPKGFLKAADTTGLGTFSFQELYAKVLADPVLNAGPAEILARREEGIYHLVEALRWLPELDLAIGMGEGDMNVLAVARVVQGWMDGKQIHELAAPFPGDDEVTRIRRAARYIYGTVSQTVSWGAHAYFGGWSMASPEKDIAPSLAMLPAYIQYGVHTPEATVASLLGVPRQFAESFADEFRTLFGPLEPAGASKFRAFVEDADEGRWQSIVKRAGLTDIDPRDAMLVFRQMQGLIKIPEQADASHKL